MTKVSVVIPTYNRAHYIGETIDSVLSQTYQDFEIIVVDDGSTDDTKKVLEKYNGKVRYIRQDNAGSAAARNRGINEAKGEYIALLDDDDLWLPEKLEKQVPVLDRNPNLAFVCSEVLTIDDNGNQLRRLRKRIDRVAEDTFEELFEENFIHVPTVLMRKNRVLAVGGYDEDMWTTQDYDLWLRLAKRYPFSYIATPLAKYRIHEHRSAKKLDVRLRNNLKIFHKKEIMEGKSFIQRRIRIAKVYHRFAGLNVEAGNSFKAGINYFKAILTYPLIGSYFWPKEARRVRFSLPYRIFKVYFLALHYYLKGIRSHLQNA